MEPVYAQHTPPSHDDGWDEVRVTLDGFTNTKDSFYASRYPNNYDYIRYGGPSTESRLDMAPTLSGPSAVELFRKTVSNARQGVKQQAMAGGGDDVGDAASQIKLTADLGHQDLEELPDEIVDILKRDVERLVLGHNQIWHIPYRFAECTALTFLNLRDNRLKEFPRALLKLPKLQVLDLSRNSLSRIPDDISNMKALKVLSVNNNNLEIVPFSLGFLESLRLLKLTSNPLNDKLRDIVAENDPSPSPLITQIVDNEKDARVTMKIKQYLRSEAAITDSGCESSSESPVDTPRPLKRHPSLRFPVIPALSGSESASDIKSPGTLKPTVPIRSHFRIASGHSLTPSNGSNRRPSIAPLIVDSERNRSNSESILQAAQSSRSKRMGIIPKRTPDLSTLDENRANRNSFHIRGASHASALREKHVHGLRMPNSHGSLNRTDSGDMAMQRGMFIRRLSSLPEHRTEQQEIINAVEGAKGVLYALHSIHPYVGTFLAVIRDGGSKRSSLERVYYNASTHLERLDSELTDYAGSQEKDRMSRGFIIKSIRHACRACLISYKQVINLLLRSASQLVAKGDQMYIRTLLLLVYSSTVEAMNAHGRLQSGSEHDTVFNEKHSLAAVHPQLPTVATPTPAPTRERHNIARRLRSDTVRSYGMKSSSNPYAAVPLYVNGRSRSNSRSNTSSVVNTPRSTESFSIPGSLGLPGSEKHMHPSAQTDQGHDATFEKVYLGFVSAVEAGLRALPVVRVYFKRSLDAAQDKYSDQAVVEVWQRFIARSQQCLESCEALRARLLTVLMKDPEVRTSTEFWNHCTRYVNSFIKLIDDVKCAKQTVSLDSEIIRTLRPVHNSVKAAVSNLKDSPWSDVLSNPPPNLVLGHGHSQWSGTNLSNGQGNGRLPGLTIFNSHRRTRGDSESSSSPYIPTTPLSAALGPAAQATIPSVPSTSLDRSFRGDVFQRAESLLNVQSSLGHRR